MRAYGASIHKLNAKIFPFKTESRRLCNGFVKVLCWKFICDCGVQKNVHKGANKWHDSAFTKPQKKSWQKQIIIYKKNNFSKNMYIIIPPQEKHKNFQIILLINLLINNSFWNFIAHNNCCCYSGVEVKSWLIITFKPKSSFWSIVICFPFFFFK